MSKSKKKKTVEAVPLKNVLNESNHSADLKWKWMIVALVFISFGLSILNDYVLDDFIVVAKNNFTQRGFKGIWAILSKDTFAGMTESNIMVLSGGRYRPLSLVTFAIEHQLFGNAPLLSHFINLLIYALSGILLYDLLKKFLAVKFPGAIDNVRLMAGCTTLLFLVLPAHSEPVINIKGRDDLMCLLFFLLSALQLMKYADSDSGKNFFLSLLFFFLSLMSKETALTFVAVFPLIMIFFTKTASGKIGRSTLFYTTIALLFLAFRYLATMDNGGTPSNDVLNNPFVSMNVAQHYATIFYSWLFYLIILFFPLHLSYDYNYNQFPTTDFSDWRVILSLVIHGGLIYIAVQSFKKKSIVSFGILFYFITFSILSNFFFNIGTIFADRFIFIPSVGICIAIIIPLVQWLKNNSHENKSIILLSKIAFIIVLVLFSARDIARCPDWKNNNTLFIADTDDAPNSAKIQLNAGIAYINLSDKDSLHHDSLLIKSIEHLQKGIDIYPSFVDGYMNMGVCYSRLRDLANAETWWNKARRIDPNHPSLKDYDKIISNNYFNIGLQKGIDKKFDESISFMKKALEYDSLNADIWYNIGGAFFTLQNKDSAIYYFQKTLSLKPDNADAMRALQVLRMH